MIKIGLKIKPKFSMLALDKNNTYEIATQRQQDKKFVIFNIFNEPESFTEDEILKNFIIVEEVKNHRNHNVGSSNYSKLTIQPWDIWKAWNLNPWDADMVKRIGRTKSIPNMTIQEARIEDYEKIIHNCEERINQLKEEINDAISKN